VKAIEIGQKYLEKEARRLGVQINRIAKSEFERVAGEYGYSKIDDLYASLGFGKYSARQVLQNAAPDQFAGVETEAEPVASPPVPAARRQLAPGDLAVKVKGSDDLLVYRAKCCNPIPGEAIVGYVTRGKGVAVHALACPNVQNLMYEVERKIDVEWGRSASDQFAVKLVVRTDDRPGLLNQLTSILSTENTNIRSLEARTDVESGDGAIIEMTVEVRDKKQLEKLVLAMRRISGVRDVERLLN
jgi:GTP pyrophosphokinase